MWSPGVDLEDGSLDQLCREPRRVVNRDELIVVTVDDQHWDVDPRQVLCEVRLRKDPDALVRRAKPCLHRLKSELVAESVGELGPGRLAPRNGPDKSV